MPKINVFAHAMRIFANLDDIIDWGSDLSRDIHAGCTPPDERAEAKASLAIATAQYAAGDRAIGILRRLDRDAVDTAISHHFDL